MNHHHMRVYALADDIFRKPGFLVLTGPNKELAIRNLILLLGMSIYHVVFVL